MKIKATAGNVYDILNVNGTKVLVTLTSKGVSSGVNMIAFGNDKSNVFVIVSLKRNRDLRLFILKNIFRSKGLKGISSIIDLAKEFNILKYNKIFNSKSFAKQLLVKENLHKSVFDSAFPELADILESEESSHKVDNFILMYDSSLKDKDKESLIKIVDESAKLMRSDGLTKPLYGKILVVDNLSPTIAADYEPSGDFIRLSRRAKKNRNSVRDLIHELGHRMMFKDMVSREKIGRKFDEEVHFSDRKVSIGDIFEDEKGNRITIKELRYKRSLLYIFEIEGKKGFFQAPSNYFAPLKKLEGKEKDNPSKWIPTSYSTKDYHEWFSEILAESIVKNNKLYKKFVKSVLI